MARRFWHQGPPHNPEAGSRWAKPPVGRPYCASLPVAAMPCSAQQRLHAAATRYQHIASCSKAKTAPLQGLAASGRKASKRAHELQHLAEASSLHDATHTAQTVHDPATPSMHINNTRGTVPMLDPASHLTDACSFGCHCAAPPLSCSTHHMHKQVCKTANKTPPPIIFASQPLHSRVASVLRERQPCGQPQLPHCHKSF